MYFFRLDRFLRTGPADAARFAEECHRAGVELVTIADGLHLKPGTDDVVTTVLLFAFSLASKLDRAAINDRIAAARERLEAEGPPTGPSVAADAEGRGEDGRASGTGFSHREIAVRVHVPRSTVTVALRRTATAAQP